MNTSVESISKAVYAPLTRGEILGITVGGGFGLFSILVVVLAWILRGRKFVDRNKQAEEAGAAVRKHQDLSQSANDLYGPQNVWTSPVLLPTELRKGWNNSQVPRNHLSETHSGTLSPQKSFFRISGLRDSWPLVSAIELPTISFDLLPNDSAISICKIAPQESTCSGGEQAKAKRTRSLLTTTKSRRTTESHLSCILRSTSQRLKAAQEQSLRALKEFGSPGTPPKKELPPIPLRPHTSSLDTSFQQNHNVSSTHPPAGYWSAARIQGSAKTVPQSRALADCGQASTYSPVSVDPYGFSRSGAANLAVPSSPIKKPRSVGLRKKTSATSSSTKHISCLMDNRKCRTLLNSDNQDSLRNAGPNKTYRLSLASNPLLLSVEPSCTIASEKSVGSRQPLYIRKSVCSQEGNEAPRRPASFLSPLRRSLGEISGNHVARTIRDVKSEKIPTMPMKSDLPNQSSRDLHLKATSEMQTRPKSRQKGHKKGHKRSKVVRISDSFASQSSAACDIPAASEKRSSSKPYKPQEIKVDFEEPLKSPCPTLSSFLDSYFHSPASPVESPNKSLILRDSTANLDEDSPTLGVFGSTTPSATTSVSLYYPQNKCLDDVHLSKRKIYSTPRKQKPHKRSQSDDIILTFSPGAVPLLAPLQRHPSLIDNDMLMGSEPESSSQHLLSLSSIQSPTIVSSDMARYRQSMDPPKASSILSSICTSAILDLEEFQRLYQKRLERKRAEQEQKTVLLPNQDARQLQDSDQCAIITPQPNTNVNPLKIIGVEIHMPSSVEDTTRTMLEEATAKNRQKDERSIPNAPVFNMFAWPDPPPKALVSNTCRHNKPEYYSPPMLLEWKSGIILSNSGKQDVDNGQMSLGLHGGDGFLRSRSD